MSTREAKAFARLRERIMRPGDRILRVENGLGAGTLDVNYCLLGGAEGWIEMKAPILPARESTPLLASQHGVTVEQANFFLAQHNAGGLAFLFVATERACVLIGAEVAKDRALVNNSTLEELVLLSRWNSGLPVAAEGWIAFRNVLRGGRNERKAGTRAVGGNAEAQAE